MHAMRKSMLPRSILMKNPDTKRPYNLTFRPIEVAVLIIKNG